MNLPSSASLRCNLGFPKTAAQEPVRLVFAALDGREAATPFPAESPITPDNICSHSDFEGYCMGCIEDCRLFESACSSEDDRRNLDTILFSSGAYCPEGAPLLSEACYDELLTCMRDECADDCEFHP